MVVAKGAGAEHLALSDGAFRLRLDILEGTLLDGPAHLEFLVGGPACAVHRLPTLRRLLAVLSGNGFKGPLFRADAAMARRVRLLRVHDALAEGASYREIARVLYGDEAVAAELKGASDFMRARVRRMAVEARRMAAGGYRTLLVQ